ncbi:hypothetical protein BGZ95_011431 [Linnemannia exigua]|uniref:receptor protein-tyrosine kinase n=1 Tax=Linnemannia exigua TaxID=604196 RepID=A0AAD4DJV3_9FUNG|nr:hypothetical protein BGZ95_011431 [Linnemannia exigua]
MIQLTSACLSIVLAMALVPAAVQAQPQEPQAPAAGDPVVPPTDTTPTTPTTTIPPVDPTTSTTTVPPVTTTTTVPPVITTTTVPPVITTTTVPPVTTTTTPPPVTTTTTTTPPLVTTTTTTTRGGVNPPPPVTSNGNGNPTIPSIQPTNSNGSTSGSNGSSTTSSSNVPAIVGGIVGALALAVIVATSVICYKRRKRANRELTFDTLEGLNGGPALSSRNRASHNYLNSGSPVITSGNVGLNSVPSAGGYDDGYDYEMQSNVGYPTSQHQHLSGNYHQQGYGNNAGYDGYGSHSPHQGYRPSPTIFQEDAPYATASSMGRGRTGFDQNLPEVMYNRGEIDADPTNGYYQDDDLYNEAAWIQEQAHAGYATGGQQQQQQHWDAQAMLSQYDHEIELPLPPTHQHAMSTPSLDSTLIGSPGRPKHQTAATTAAHHASNPQAILESPILQSATLRSGDLFSQEATSPRIATQQLQQLQHDGDERQSPKTSPRIINASREMRSIELATHSPTFGRPSTDAINSYANEYQSRPSTDMAAAVAAAGGDAGSPLSPSSNLNPNKSLRTLRREDW